MFARAVALASQTSRTSSASSASSASSSSSSATLLSRSSSSMHSSSSSLLSSTSTSSSSSSYARLLALGAGVAGALLLANSASNEAECSDAVTPSPAHPWSHRLPWQSLDKASVRRGFEVYRQVCSTCHSLDRIAYRNLVGTLMTEAEAKELAAESEFQDGPDDEGEMFDRPGKLTDYMPRPYPNEKAARAANKGALPPDLSLITKARPAGADYVHALLTGYHATPAGVPASETMYYNPYFPGGMIGMTPPLVDGGIDYEDGTEGSVSQQAKDVTTFLSWAAEPEQDERKLMGLKTLFVLSAMTAPVLYWKRFKFAVPKHRQIKRF